MAAVITNAQLREHSTRESLWLAVHGQVYDLTAFAVDHPGGIDVLVETAGTDATETYDYAGHSDGAMQTMQAFAVGPLEGAGGHLNRQPAGDSKTSKSSLLPSFSVSMATKPGAVRTARAGFFSPRWAGIALPLLGVAVLLVGACKVGVWKGRGEEEEEEATGGGFGAVPAFVAGLGLASSVSCAGLAVAYSWFSETLKMEKEVFAYPPTIPRRVLRSMIDV
ncbi:cytochrome b5 [Diplodia corticola]|uniref:Cytochrome b5 n=1 Tax=Diplodia corticola TaxID=236234 RepID=A0A1J9RUI4_9PEZI|nr:cytochrome b5 [Diplodia corticola]OJD32087.1 cytochrome b5 [Diplodia corticola]